MVSPLVSLIEDQVMALKKINIPAEMLNASVEKSEVTRILNDMTNPKSEIRLLYVTPEKLAKSKRFMAKLQKSYSMGLFQRMAIDEVHCCSTWGNDFRPDYKYLGKKSKSFYRVSHIEMSETKWFLGVEGSIILLIFL